ncbi:hypothetical protein GH714_027534 [Hevea brasiliensis]|uniref:SLH domain-containing protein n=1 Tax=Hevea brasiliensis TaxID=3981 RepID=A0A6A6N4Q1_HEVBR|nr:hypothetical protein GH714_027424 [Hevea brasiliensis]KAF2320447.1 hypothetical protein GH714_027534 [Hevea brasiliensis]
MASMASICSPTSLKLRLAMKSRNFRGSPAILIRTRVRKLDPQIRVLCAAQNGNGVERLHDRCSMIASGAAANNFAGWSDSDDGDQSPESKSQRQKWLPGIVGAGVAGVVLVAGLTLAALSLSKQSTSRPKQQMEPLTTHQEVSLVSNVEDDELEKNKSEKSSVKQDHRSPKHMSSPELFEAPNENKLSVSSHSQSQTPLVDNEKYVSSHDTIDKAPIQEHMQYESVSDGKSDPPEMIPNSMNLPDSEIADDSLAASIPQSISEIEQNLVNGEPADLLNIKNPFTDHEGGLPSSELKENSYPLCDSSNSPVHESSKPVDVSISVTKTVDAAIKPGIFPKDDKETVTSHPAEENLDTGKTTQAASTERNNSSLEVNYLNESEYSGTTSVSPSAYPFANRQDVVSSDETIGSRTSFVPTPFSSSFLSAGIPAPSAVSEAMQVSPEKVLVPAVVDQAQALALAALQALKVIEADVLPSDLCTRREYARWLVAASSALSRNTLSKVYPAMYIENATELAFDDITPDDPDFSSIQGLAEAGLISSRLSNHDLFSSSDEEQGPFYFSPESPLSRQHLVSWKMALEKRQLPEADGQILYQLSGFRDIDKINPDAWPALIADLSAGDQGIISLAFGCTRLFQPDKPVTKAQAAVALATGEASDIVIEELARIEAESVAENVVSAHNALVAQVEQDLNASFEKELSMDGEKINAVEKMAEEARLELEKLRAEREADNIALMKERAAIEAEMEVLSRLRSEVEEQLQSLLTGKVEISYEKERISKLQKEAENEKQEISQLQYELEVERKALSMARAWAEDEAKRAREHAKAIEEARDHWERHGIKVVVDSDLREESSAGVASLAAAKQFSVEGTASGAENLVDKLKLMADDVKGKSREVIHKIIQNILILISLLKEWALKASTQAKELKDATILNAKGSIQELQQNTSEFSLAIKERARGSIQGLQQSTAEFSIAVKEGAKRVAEDCRESVEKLTHKFKS